MLRWEGWAVPSPSPILELCNQRWGRLGHGRHPSPHLPLTPKAKDKQCQSLAEGSGKTPVLQKPGTCCGGRARATLSLGTDRHLVPASYQDGLSSSFLNPLKLEFPKASFSLHPEPRSLPSSLGPALSTLCLKPQALLPPSPCPSSVWLLVLRSRPHLRK